MTIGFERPFNRIGILVLLLAAFLAPESIRGQDPELVVPLQFSLSDPGARSMGFGGAFVALADDATAAFANPAGLVQLARPEVSIEGRRWSYSTPFTERGRIEGLPSGYGIDTTEGLRTARSEVDLTGLSFLSVAYPKGKWSVAFFRHEWANLEYRSETQGLWVGGTSCCQTRLLDQRASTDLEFVSYGISGALRASERFDIGLALIQYDVSIASDATLYLPDDDSVESILALNSYLPERSYLGVRFSADDTDWGLAGGFLWRLSERWQIGGVYRQGPTIDVASELVAGEAVDFGVPPGETLIQNSGVPMDLPWIVGLGVAYRAASGGLTVSLQWDHIEYSRILESLDVEEQVADDAREVHLGGEYVFLGSTPLVAVRLGVWLDPDHQVRATEAASAFLQALAPRGDDEMHYAAGLGVAFERFQIDLGVDIADPVDTVSVSAIVNF